MSDRISVLVVDDEEISREYVVGLVRQDNRFSVVAESSDGLQAVEDFERFRPGAVFIDLEMPGLHGFEFCQRIDTSLTSVIFVTAHGSQALTAFDFQAVDFVTKPIQTDRFAKTLQRVYEHEIARHLIQDTANSSEARDDSSASGRRVIRAAQGRLFFYPREVQFIESSGNYVKVWIHNKPHLIRDTFQHFCESLEYSEITIVHRRYAVNVQHVREIVIASQSGCAKLKIIGIKKSIPVSRSRRAAVLALVDSKRREN